MRKILVGAFSVICITSGVLIFDSCSKKHDSPEPPPVITPTKNPLPHSVMVYLITPTDRTFNADYYKAAKLCIQNMQGWFKTQLGNNRTFVVNPVVVDTLTGLHNSIWYDSNNGDSVIGYHGPSYAYFNIRYELKQVLGTSYDTVGHAYFAFVVSDFPEETIPGRLGVEGSSNLDGLLSKFPDGSRGSAAHALGHAFGLVDDKPDNDQLLMSTGRFKYPSCIFTQAEKDSLDASLFLQ